MPQIAQIGEIYASQLFWLAIFFGAIFFIIGRGMLPKVMSTVDARNEKIAADLKAAEGARTQADALEESYRTELDRSRAEANRLQADAKAKAAKASEKKLKTADAAVETKINKAMADLAKARDAAKSELETVAAEAAQDLIAKVSGLKLDAKTVQAAVKKELANG